MFLVLITPFREIDETICLVVDDWRCHACDWDGGWRAQWHQAPQAPAGPQPYSVGNRLGMPINPAPDGKFDPMSKNVKVYGAIYSAESCSYDPTRGVIVVPNRGVGQNVQTNNAWISFINHDGSVHTARWVGIQNPGDQRSTMKPALVLNEPLGSDIANGVLYLADRDGGTSPTDPAVSVIRKFDMKTGMPAGEVKIEKSTGFNDIEVADDGTIYANADRRRRTEPRCDDVAGVEDHAKRQRVDLHPGRTAASAERRSPSTRRATSSSSTSATTKC